MHQVPLVDTYPRTLLVAFIGACVVAGCNSGSGSHTNPNDSAVDSSGHDAPVVVQDTGQTADTAYLLGDVDLGTAGTFAILAGSAITNTGYTTITGDVGISPGTALTGFPPGVVMDGAIYIADNVAASAKHALNTAYINASQRSGSPVTVTGDLGGRTLTPGLYVSSTSLEITVGDLTLDAGGATNAIWVFQIGSSFTSATGSRIILANGARSTNVFWQVGSSTTIGADSDMAGNFLTEVSTTAQSGARVEGRLLTQNGAVTLETNIVIRTIPVLF